jgi:RNA polymerase sigma-70 factor (ECF subfamily)
MGTTNGHTSDTQLIQAARRGDRKAFSTLARRYEQTVYRFAFSVCRDPEKAAEALQDTFINVFRKLDSFDGRSKFSTWLYSIVTNNCLMKRRRRKSDELLQSLDTLADPSDGASAPPARAAQPTKTPADVLLAGELRSLLDEAILKLPLPYRLAFILRDIEGKSTEETAEIMRISVEAAKSRIRRARAFLRGRLAPYLEDRTGPS